MIFEAKDVTVFDKDGNKTLLFVPRKTILVDESLKDKENSAVIHECVHINLHRLFYYLQSHYRNAVGKAAPEFQDYFYSDSQRECVAWMETQANSIANLVPITEISESTIAADNRQYQYNKDYFVGDYVTVEHERFGLIQPKIQLVGMIESYDQNGRTLTPTFKGV